jgi:hypothetical protein
MFVKLISAGYKVGKEVGVTECNANAQRHNHAEEGRKKRERERKEEKAVG